MPLKITIPASEFYDPVSNRFYESKEQTLTLEHSLVSLSKWESKWHKPFLNRNEKSYEESLDYVRCMTLTQNVDPIVYKNIDMESIQKINEYIDDPMTAYRFRDSDGPGSGEKITNELIYYWMIALNIPMECQKWHLNRLLTLIRICSIKNTPPKKMTAGSLSKRASLNAARRAKLHTKG